MARKRMIDPEFWSDEEIGAWSFPARLFYIGLWNFADDEGRFKAHNNLLKSQIFPYDSKIDIDKLKRELNHKIQWYEVEGLQYGYIRNFLKYQQIQHPTASKLPAPISVNESSMSPQLDVRPNIIKYNLIKYNINTPQKPGGAVNKSVNKSVFTKEEKVILETIKTKTNIYALIEEFKNVHKVYPPKDLLIRVCKQFIEKGSDIQEPYPYLKAALHRAAQDEENLNWKKEGMAQSLKDILGIK